MALKKETLALIAKVLRIKPEDFENALKGETENELVVDENLHVFSDDELTILKNNEYGAGKGKGLEMAVKETKEKRGLDFTGKTLDGLIDAIEKKTLADAKIEPAKQVTELTEKLKTVQATATELQTKLAERESEISTVKSHNLIVKDLPGNTSLPTDKVLLLMKADGYEYKVEDGKVSWVKDGKVLTDKLGNSLSTKDVSTEYITVNKLIAEPTPPGGRGPGDNSGGKGGKFSDIKKKFEAEGKSLLGKEFSDAVAIAVKEDPAFDMAS